MKIMIFPHSLFNVLRYDRQVVISHGTNFIFLSTDQVISTIELSILTFSFVKSLFKYFV